MVGEFSGIVTSASELNELFEVYETRQALGENGVIGRESGRLFHDSLGMVRPRLAGVVIAEARGFGDGFRRHVGSRLAQYEAEGFGVAGDVRVESEKPLGAGVREVSDRFPPKGAIVRGD